MDPVAAVAFALPKAEILSVLAYAIGAAVVFHIVIHGARAAPLHPVHLLVVGYLAVAAISTAFGVEASAALWGAYDRRLGLVATLQLGLIYIGAAMFVRSVRAASLLMLAVAAGGLLVGSYEAIQALGLDPIRWGAVQAAFATLGNSNVLSQYMATLSAGSVAFLLRFAAAGRAWAVAVPAALGAAFAVGMVVAQGRAALLGFGAGALFAFAVSARRVMTTPRRAVVVAGLVAAAVLAAAVLLTVSPPGARVLALFSNDSSVTARASIYKSMLTIFSDHPLVGVGPDNVGVVYNAYRRPESVHLTTFLNTSAHGWPWRIAAEGGALGLASFTLLLMGLAVVAARALRQTPSWSALVLSTAIVTYLVSGVFTVDHLGTAWMFWLAAGSLVGLAAGPPASAAVRWPTRPLALVLTVGVLWPLAPLVSDIGASRAVHASRAPGLSASQAVAAATRGVEADSRWASHWTNLGQRAVAAGDRALALRAFSAAAERAPYDPLIWRNLGTVQAQSGEPGLRAEARESAHRALAADPHNPEAAAAAAQVYVLVGDGELAALAYRRAGRPADAQAAIESALRAGETWQRRYILAEILISQRDFQGARVQLQRVLQLDPGNQSASTLLGRIEGQ